MIAQRLFRSLFPVWLVLLMAFCGFAVTAQAQQDPSTMRISDVQSRTASLVSQGDFLGAQPYLRELVYRYEQEDDPAIKEQLKDVYFFMGISYLQEYTQGGGDDSLRNSIKWFERYEQEFPEGERMPTILMNRGDAKRGLGQMEEAAKDFEKLLNPPFASELDVDKRLEALRKISQCYYLTQNWDKGPRYFSEYLKLTKDEDEQSFAAAALMEAYLNKNQFSKALDILSFLVGDSPARYNLQFNLALLEAGDGLVDKKRYAEAALVYSLVKTIPQIERFLAARENSLYASVQQLRRLYPGGNERINETETELFNTQERLKAVRELVEKGQGYTAELKVRIARNYMEMKRLYEAFWAYLRIVEEHQDHQQAGNFIFAAFMLAMEVGIDDQIERLGETYLDDPRVAAFRSDIGIKLAEYYSDKGLWDKLTDIAALFLGEDQESNYARQMVYYVGSALLEQEDYITLDVRFTELLDQYKDKPIAEGLYYWRGMSRMMQDNYESAKEDLENVLAYYENNNVPQNDRVYGEDAQYRIAVCLYGMGEYEAARDRLVTFIEKHPKSVVLGEAVFFLGDVYAILNEPEKALANYMRVKELTNNLGFIQSAYVQAGKLLELSERWEDMEAHYTEFIDTYGDRLEVSTAYSQLGKALYEQGEVDPMLEAYQKGIRQYGNDPAATGVDTILKNYPEQYYEERERLRDNVEFFSKLAEDQQLREKIHTDRTFLYRTFMENKNLDQDIGKQLQRDRKFTQKLITDTAPIQKWLERYQRELNQYPEQTPEEFLRPIHRSARNEDKQTLRFRTIMALDKLGANPEPQLTLTDADFDYASPALLVWMGDRMRSDNVDAARLAYQTVVEEYPDAPQRPRAMLRLAELERSLGNTQRALQLYADAEKDFAGTKDGEEIVLGHARLLIDAGQDEKARDKLQFIIQNPDWRGEATAEALYRLGELAFQNGNMQAAYLYFEQVFLGHQYYTEWAARSYLRGAEAKLRAGERAQAKEIIDEGLTLADVETTSVVDQMRTLQARL